MKFVSVSRSQQVIGLLMGAALCLGLAQAVCRAAPQAAKEDIQYFQGSWDVAKLSIDGADLPLEELQGFKLSFKDNKILLSVQGFEKSGTVTIDSSTKPKHIDLEFDGGDIEPGFGIFEANGATVKIYASKSKSDRPKGFAADAPIMITLKRAAAGKADDTPKKGAQLHTVTPALALAAVPDDPQTDADRKLIQGTWQPTTIRLGNQKLPDEVKQLMDDMRIVIGDGKITFTLQDLEMEGTFKLDPSQKPKQIDLSMNDTKLEGIYELKGDKIRICGSEPGKGRPTTFASDSNMVIELQRMPEQPPPSAPSAVQDDAQNLPAPLQGAALILPSPRRGEGAGGRGLHLIAVQDKKSDVELIQGKWLVESMIDDGMAIDPTFLQLLKFQVAGDKITITAGEDGHFRGKYKADENAKPKTIDVDYDEGPKFLGIYELSGDTVKFCLAEVGDKDTKRPTEFKSVAGSGHKLIILKRAKEEKKSDARAPQIRPELVALLNDQDKGGKAIDDKQGLQGTWQVASLTAGGMKIPDDFVASLQLTVKGDAMTFSGKEGKAMYKIDPSKKPKQIDITPDAGSPGTGIFELNGDTLKICIVEGTGGPRPTEFSSPEGTSVVLMELKRAAEKKEDSKEEKKGEPEEEPAELVFCSPDVADSAETRSVTNDTSDADRIMGIWKLLQARGDGEDGRAEMIDPVRLTFDTDGTLVVEGTANNSTGFYKLDDTKQPKQLTVLMSVEKNQSIAGIYKFDADKLVICFKESADSTERPKEFSAEKGSKQTVFVLEQLKTGVAMVKDRLEESERADRAKSARNLQQIGLAFHIKADVDKGTFPAHTIYSKDGRTPLLSWRVEILQFLEEPVYREFKFDEPWDSEHNKKLIAKMPKIFEPVGRGRKGEGLTYYQVFTGKNTLFNVSKRFRLADITDGTSNTILVVEAKDPVIWSKPDDLVLPNNPKDPLPELGGMFTSGMNILLCDASVRWVRRDIPPATLRSLITPNGNEPVNVESLMTPADDKAAMKKAVDKR